LEDFKNLLPKIFEGTRATPFIFDEMYVNMYEFISNSILVVGSINLMIISK
jgi:hypothetical protein